MGHSAERGDTKIIVMKAFVVNDISPVMEL